MCARLDTFNLPPLVRTLLTKRALVWINVHHKIPQGQESCHTSGRCHIYVTWKTRESFSSGFHKPSFEVVEEKGGENKRMQYIYGGRGGEGEELLVFTYREFECR